MISSGTAPFYSVNRYYRELFGEKVYKLSLDGGMTCPNRDGKLDTRGCIFCSEGGSGDFSARASLPIHDRITEAISYVAPKYKGDKYIAYFQAYTNTYAPVEYLRNLFTETCLDPRIAGISIATRPDCLEDDKISLLRELNRVKPVWVELGLQTIKESSAEYIRRGYPLSVFEDTYERLTKAGIPAIIHVIIGLPGESYEDNIACAGFLAKKHIHGVKLQLLHVLQNTDLAVDYEKGLFKALSMDDYINRVIGMIEKLPPETVIYRITGDGPRNSLIAPLWSLNKKNVLNSITKEFARRNTYQGKEYL